MYTLVLKEDDKKVFSTHDMRISTTLYRMTAFIGKKYLRRS